MKKRFFYFGLALFTYGFLFTQNIFAMGSMHGIVVGIAASDGYSGSQNSLYEFCSRLKEIENDRSFNSMVENDLASIFHGNYSGSQNTLHEFKRRFDEIKNDRNFNNMAGTEALVYYGHYAGSQNSLQEFIRRFNEIMNNRDFSNIARDGSLA